ncbi:hypothetical protein ACQJBY_068654 [Aegilops geniculata]
MPPRSNHASSSSATPRAQLPRRSAALLLPCPSTRLLRPRAVWSRESRSALCAHPQSASPDSLASTRLSRLAAATLRLLPACQLPAYRLRHHLAGLAGCRTPTSPPTAPSLAC